MSKPRGALVTAMLLIAVLAWARPNPVAGGEIGGNLPAEGGLGLVAWSGGTTADLIESAGEQGCMATSIWIFVRGFPVGYIVGAPESVNAPFLAINPGAELPPTALVIVCRQAVIFEPGADIAAIAAARPPGTLYRLRPGTYREQQITPKDGDTFVGDDGAVLNGSRVLTGFQAAGAFWAIGGQTSELFGGGSCSKFEGRSYSGCTHPEQLFLDGELLWQVTDPNDLASGRWYFDYGDNRIYLVDSPLGRSVELSVASAAFSGEAKNVTISNLVIEKYANRAQTGAIAGNVGTNWLIENSEIRFNHGTGIRVGSGMVIRDSFVHHSGQLGIGGIGDNVLVEQNEIAENGISGFSPGWEGGGTKFVKTRDLIVRGNYVHHNRGRGLWTDIDNIDSLFEDNLVELNDAEGITHEISYAAIIRNNTVRYNGRGFDVWLWGAQILVQNSSDTLVTGNTVVVSAEGGNGIGVVNQNRGGSGTFGPWISQRVTVQGNEITFLGSAGSAGLSDDTATSFACGADADNHFDGNTYHIADLEQMYWSWCGDKNWDEFQSLGLEQAGTVAVGLAN